MLKFNLIALSVLNVIVIVKSQKNEGMVSYLIFDE